MKITPLTLVTLVAVTGGFLFGYDTAVVNGANQFLRIHFNLTPFQEGIAGASAILGCIPGALFAGALSDRLGRKRTLFICAILYAVSGVFSAIPASFAQFLVARFVSGLGIGASSMICPIYIAELAPAARRGRLGSMFQLGIVSGIFVTLFINAIIQGAGDATWNASIGWRWMLGAEVAPAVALFALLVSTPESPRWLVQKNRRDEATKILITMGGETHAREELRLVDSAKQEQEGTFLDLFSPRFRRPLVIAVVLMAVSQLSGINAIMYYSTKIFATGGAFLADSFKASVIVGLVNLLFTFVAIAFVDRLGRRSLLIAGLALQVAALTCVSFMFHAGYNGLPLLIAVLVFIAAFAMALGPIPWIVCSEIFPTAIRGRAMALSTFVIWTACYVVAQTFPVLNDSPAIGPSLTFGFYSFCSAAGLIFVVFRLPETKGKELETISKELGC